ncbi:MAG TPA: metal-sensitive transcriptional regulator [Marmoricola sp.]|nr:metal-sensitive transcriptional regulator [Marmoricola sp.]
MSSTHGYHDHKADYLRRLRRIEGQVRGIHRMVDEDEYCIDILTQVAAIKSALQSVAVGLVQDHLDHCVRDAIVGAAEGDEQGTARAEAKITEAGQAITRLLKA